MKVLDESQLNSVLRKVSVGSDFLEADSLAAFSTVEADTGASVALATGANAIGGKALLTTGATDNNEAYIFTDEVFKFTADKPFIAHVSVQYAESATDDANVAVGLMDAVGANSILDNGAGPKAAYSGAVVYKTDGSTVWAVEASVNGGATQYGGTSTTTAGGTTAQVIRIEFQPFSSTKGDVLFSIADAGGTNFIPLEDSNGNILKYEIDFTTVTEMSLFAGAKAGSASSELVYIDFLGAAQTR